MSWAWNWAAWNSEATNPFDQIFEPVEITDTGDLLFSTATERGAEVFEIEKDGDYVRIERDRRVLLPTANGYMSLEREVEFRLRVQGDRVVVDRQQGVYVGLTSLCPLRVRTMTFYSDGGEDMVDVRVAWKTMTFALADMAPPGGGTPSGGAGMVDAF